MTRIHTMWTSLLLLAMGCGGAVTTSTGDGSSPLERAAQRAHKEALVSDNGRSLNGRSLNGRSLNGRSLNGRSLNGRSLNGRSLNGASWGGLGLRSVTVEGSELVLETVTGEKVRGTDVIGAELDDAEFAAYRFRVDTVERDGDVWQYRLSYRARSRWSPVCEDDRGAAVPAMVLSGYWNYAEGEGGGSHIPDPDVVTFACEGAALFKCVELGYAPWREGFAGHHQACTRMLRADYCGTGRSFMRDGTLINLYDGVGIQLDTERWTLEAEWNEDGAVCVDTPRIRESIPRCARDQVLRDCGAKGHFGTGTLLMTESRARSKD